MSSFFTKALVENEFDKVIKSVQELTFGENDDENKDSDGFSSEDVLAEKKRQAAMEKERQARRAKIEEEREEARQKIRDKYNIKKKDEPASQSHRKTVGVPNESKPVESHQASSVVTDSSDSAKKTTNVFNSLKKKLGWK